MNNNDIRFDNKILLIAEQMTKHPERVFFGDWDLERGILVYSTDVDEMLAEEDLDVDYSKEREMFHRTVICDTGENFIRDYPTRLSLANYLSQYIKECLDKMETLPIQKEIHAQLQNIIKISNKNIQKVHKRTDEAIAEYQRHIEDYKKQAINELSSLQVSIDWAEALMEKLGEIIKASNKNKGKKSKKD